MAGGYTDTPHNMEEILPYVTTGKERTAAELLESQTCYFYDACSFRRHSNLKNGEADYLFRYIKKQNGIVVIMRCILMELASKSGILNQEYVSYIRQIAETGIQVLVVYEEDIFTVLEACFSTNAAINQYLCWSVRTMKIPAFMMRLSKEKIWTMAEFISAFFRQSERIKKPEMIWEKNCWQFVCIFCLIFQEKRMGNSALLQMIKAGQAKWMLCLRKQQNSIREKR